MAASPNDNTSVIRMMDEFKKFTRIPTKKTPGNSSVNKNLAARLSFGEDTNSISDVIRQRLKESDSNLKNSQASSTERDDNKWRKDREREMLIMKSSVRKFESEMLSNEISNKRARLELESKLEKTEHERKKGRERCEDVSQQLRELTEREERAVRKLSDTQEQLKSAKHQFDLKFNSVQREKLNLENTINDLRVRYESELSDCNRSLFKQDHELKCCQANLEFTKHQLLDKQDKLKFSASNAKAVEEYKAKMDQANYKIRELEIQLSRQDELVMISKMMKSKLDRMPELEKENQELKKENKHLREVSDNCSLLKEQNKSSSFKLERLEERLTLYNETMLENQSLINKLDEWNQACLPILDPPSASSLSSHVQKLQKSEAVLLEQVGSLTTACHVTENKLQVAKNKIEELKKQVQSTSKLYEDQVASMRRLQRKMMLITEERNLCRYLLNGYENDMTANLTNQSAERIQKLEKILDGYRVNCEKLEEELRTYKKQMSNNPSLQNTDNSAVHEKLRHELKEMENEVKVLDGEKKIIKDKLDSILSQIGYDPTKTQIFSFLNNPASIASQKISDEFDELKNYNQKLKERVRILEERRGQEVEDLTAQVDMQIEKQGSVKSREELQEQLTSEEQKRQRMMEAFKKTTKDFREVVKIMLGYRIDVPRNNFYKISSMYAESPDDCLLFQMDEGIPKLLENDYSLTLVDLVQTHLHQQRSIPVFLSTLTIDLFGHQTVSFAP